MTTPIQPGAVLGVLGGGQLGRMFAQAAARMGYRVDVFAPGGGTPAGEVASRETIADYDDLDAIEAFSRSVDVVTFEFENVPAATAEAAARHAPVRPPGALLHASQDRLREKRALMELGLPVAPFAEIAGEAQLEPALASVPPPGILKTARWGYDGHGQRRVDRIEDLAPAWRELGEGPAVLEQRIDFVAELSVVGARGQGGELALYEPTLNRHENHILDLSTSPGPFAPRVVREATEIARAVLEGFDVAGVLCVELFLLADDTLLVNEVAPRPHNSGHLTIDAHACSQFEQQVRAICGLPLGSTERVVPAAAMANLLGDLWEGGAPDWAAALAQPGARLHLYGKGEPRPGRKMGHLTVTAETVEAAEERAVAARRRSTRSGGAPVSA